MADYTFLKSIFTTVDNATNLYIDSTSADIVNNTQVALNLKGGSCGTRHPDWMECLTADLGVHQPRSAAASSNGHTGERPMTPKSSFMACLPKLPSTTIDYAGCVSKSDLNALASDSLSMPQARYLAHALAVAVGGDVSVTHEDIEGIVRHFVVSAGQAIPADFGRPRLSVLVSM